MGSVEIFHQSSIHRHVLHFLSSDPTQYTPFTSVFRLIAGGKYEYHFIVNLKFVDNKTSLFHPFPPTPPTSPNPCLV